MSQIAQSENGKPVFMLFPSEAETQDVQVAIFSTVGDDTGTVRWAIPRRIETGGHTGKWCIPKPADPSRLSEITGYEEAEYQSSWWPDPTLQENPE